MKTVIEPKYAEVLHEALDDFQYKIALELNALKGKAMTDRRKKLTKHQKLVEALQSILSEM